MKLLRQMNARAMTLIEITIVVGLITIISVALYNGLSNGLRVWKYSQQLRTEEDIALFFEKISHDLRNSLLYSQMPFKSDFYSFSFPAIVRAIVDSKSGQEATDTIGMVEYSFDVGKKCIVRKQADYGQALGSEFDPAQTLVSAVDGIKFAFIYVTEKDQLYSEKILETIPSAVEVEVKFTDNNQKRSLKRIIDVPIGN